MIPIHCEFLMGLGGRLTSSGVVQMYTDALRRPNVTANLREWDQWQDSVQTISELPKHSKVAVLGYSNGACTATDIAFEDFQVDLLVGFDRTIWLPARPLGGNVKRAICLWNVNPFSSFPPVGHGTYSMAQGVPASRLTTRRITDFHINVDKNPANQKIWTAALDLLVAQP